MLPSLPTEVVELIVALTDWEDVSNLRLVSRDIMVKCSGGIFKTLFLNKTVTWSSKKQLLDFVEVTKPGMMGCLLQQLKLVGSQNATIQAATDRLLTKAFSNLHQNSANQSLPSLVLAAKDRNYWGDFDEPRMIVDDWKKDWDAAARTFDIATRALAKSTLKLHKLDIFDSTTRCSLACDRIAPALDSRDLNVSLQGVTHLSLSLSDQFFTRKDLFSGQKHVRNILSLLKLFPDLITLELHWHTIYVAHEDINLSAARNEQRRFLVQAIQLNNYSQIQECRLRGIKTDETTLLELLNKMPKLLRITMDEIQLDAPGKYQPIFDLLTEQYHLEYFSFNELWEHTIKHAGARPKLRHVYFPVPGEPYQDPFDGPNDLSRSGLECRYPISYALSKIRPGFPLKLLAWSRRRKLMYGPVFTH